MISDRFVNRNQLCWTCQKATGYCDWSSHLKPIDGWDAERNDMLCHSKHSMDDFYIDESYIIFDCPEYVADEVEE